jgi:hypothetical protein
LQYKYICFLINADAQDGVIKTAAELQMGEMMTLLNFGTKVKLKEIQNTTASTTPEPLVVLHRKLSHYLKKFIALFLYQNFLDF